MLFLGTEKYPKENDYESFLSKYGGFSNAYTDMEDTNYYFSLTTTAPKTNKAPGAVTDDSHKDDDACTTNGSAASSSIPTSPALEGSLDRLAQFFIAPKFETGMVDREIKAIDSEWRNARTSDAWRNYQHLKAAGNPHHPFAKFGCGNLETLTANGAISPRSELLDFWKRHYQTYNMRLAVVGYASLDAMQATVEKTFGELPYSEGQHRRIPKEPLQDQVFPFEGAQYEAGVKAFGPEQLGKHRQVIPVMESRTLKLQFASPPVDDPVAREARPHRIISHLLGHEAPGSLHALLNDLGYIQSLSSGMAISTSDFALFSVSMGLTPKGMAHKQEVLELAFQWISLISKAALDPANLERMEQYDYELRQIFLNNFKFRENGDPTDFCSTVAELMFDTEVPPNRILIGMNDQGKYDPEITKAFLERLKPANCLIVETNSDLAKETEPDAGFEKEAWQTEPWYGAQYRVRDLSEEQIQAWENPASVDARLQLPGLNEYIPTDFSLRCDKAANGDAAAAASKVSEAERNAPPQMIMERKGLRLWHKMDKYWRVPKAFIRFSMVTPDPYRSPRTMTYNRIYQRLLNDDLKSSVYDATMGGCNYRYVYNCIGNVDSMCNYLSVLTYVSLVLSLPMFL